MAQATILAAGTTAAASTDIVVAAGALVTVGIFAAATVLEKGQRAIVYLDTPGADVQVAELNMDKPSTVISGPGTFRVRRPALTGTGIGVFTEA